MSGFSEEPLGESERPTGCGATAGVCPPLGEPPSEPEHEKPILEPSKLPTARFGPFDRWWCGYGATGTIGQLLDAVGWAGAADLPVPDRGGAGKEANREEAPHADRHPF